MRLSDAKATLPATGGSCALRRLSAAAAASVATSITRMPPTSGIGNSRDSMRSPSTVTATLTRVPGVSPVNVARPLPSVFDVFDAPPPLSSTVWPSSGLESCPRITRAVTVPTMRSPTGSGMPDICLGSGIWARSCGACTKMTTQTDPTTKQRSQRSETENMLVFVPLRWLRCFVGGSVHFVDSVSFKPQALQKRASASLAVPQEQATG
jgi:hypothetical protein